MLNIEKYCKAGKKLILSTILLSTILIAKAQEETDVLRLSDVQNISTARSLGIGGAVGSIGADFAGISVNPASLGRYSKNEFMFTPSFKINTTKGKYLDGTEISADKSKLTVDNIGLVVAKRKKKNDGWRSSNFAMGFNRTANFNRSYSFSGINYKSSMTDLFVQQQNKIGGFKNLQNASLPTLMAYGTYVIDTVGNDPSKTMFSYIPVSQGINQSKIINETGGISELAFSLASSNKDKIFLGATLGLPFVNYSRNATYTERDITKALNDFESFSMTENINTSGLGINLKVGAIYAPNHHLRFGAALHTPTYFDLSEQTDYVMKTNLENLGSYSLGGDANGDYRQITEYNVSTPFKAILSATVLSNKIGFVTADYEYVDYTSASIKFPSSYNASGFAANINNVIDKINSKTQNIRIGAEARLKEYALRAGYAITGSPINKQQYDASRNNFSLGAGYRASSFFADIAWVNSNQNTQQYNYVLDGVNVPPATVKNNYKFLTLTMGWKF